MARGSNTTISIAHRLSTIQRADQIVVLSSTGTVAEQGTFQELTANPDSHFIKLMEWQMSGREPGTAGSLAATARSKRGPPTEKEREEQRMQAEEDEAAGLAEEDEPVQARAAPANGGQR